MAEPDVERILGPAILSPEGIVYFVRIPGSHYSLAQQIRGAREDVMPLYWRQGFMTSQMRFVDRKEAKSIAIAANQLVNPISGSGDLFSEELWINTEGEGEQK